MSDSAPEPVFEDPWHAQLFALTVHLNETGRFDWPDWAARFSATLKRHGLERELNGGADYFNAWLETLEDLLAESGEAGDGERDRVRQAWENAYLTTPHGQPVHLPG
ncbi:nitrile hydratase accessory protein [Ruegeria sp. 2012CJ41-6]|uniref:Nitrile hydratase accessory protein n=1 Tax=Ruegeria spongiae TaxID=2942209 RepID=A0ABT0Q6A5_9RHOB|nr:nitrile hydratase accessory protein [Ruegeria spongiae]MCL6284419.1 nitrile hydratase accessory protein [Ruegeria spongiae]